MEPVRIALLIAAAVTGLCSPSFAQARKSEAAVIAEMERYRLTMEDVRKVVQAGRNLELIGASAMEVGRAGTINPTVTQALRDAGLTIEQFLKITTVWIAVTYADMMPPEEAARMLKEAHVHPDNLGFVQRNRQALNQLEGN